MQNDSFFNVKAPTGPPSMDSDNEDSFEILGTHSLSDEASLRPPQEEVLAPIRMSKVHDMQNLIKMEISQISNGMPEEPPADNLSEVSTTIASRVISLDCSHEEIQKHVEELIKENEKLKIIIEQNNITMKNQYARIVAWKDEVYNVYQSYKEKLAEAKQFIDKSKEENGKLTSEIEVYRNLKKLHEEEILNLREKVNDFENKRTVDDKLDKNIIELDIKILKDKVRDLENELAETNLEKGEISRENEKLIEKMISTPKMEEDLQEKQKLIDELQLQIAAGKNYENMIEELRSEIQSGKNREKELLDKSIILKNKIQELEQELQKQPSGPSLQIVDSYKQQIQLKDDEISKLQDALNVSTAEFEKAKYQMGKLQKIVNPNLQQEYQILRQEHQNTRQQLSNAQMTVTALNQDVEAKVKEIEGLKILLTQASTKDEIYALKEQLALYKSDFDAEKESKNSIKRERDQMAEDMKNLQTRNGQLQNEVERWRALNQPKSATNEFLCPKCSFGFNSYQSLENHVHRCLDLEGFP